MRVGAIHQWISNRFLATLQLPPTAALWAQHPPSPSQQHHQAPHPQQNHSLPLTIHHHVANGGLRIHAVPIVGARPAAGQPRRISQARLVVVEAQLRALLQRRVRAERIASANPTAYGCTRRASRCSQQACASAGYASPRRVQMRPHCVAGGDGRRRTRADVALTRRCLSHWLLEPSTPISG